MAITNELKKLLRQLGELATLAESMDAVGNLDQAKAEAAASIDAARRGADAIKAEAEAIKAQAEDLKAEAEKVVSVTNFKAADIIAGANSEYEAIVAKARQEALDIAHMSENERRVAAGKLAAVNAQLAEKTKTVDMLEARTVELEQHLNALRAKLG